MKNKKDLGVIIQFDDKEYSKEEIEFFWGRFISILAEAKNIKFDTKITQNLTNTIKKTDLISVFFYNGGG